MDASRIAGRVAHHLHLRYDRLRFVERIPHPAAPSMLSLLVGWATRSVILISLVTLGSIGAARCAWAQDPNPIPHLVRIWKSQESEIATAHLKYRAVRMGASGIRPLSPDQVNEIVHTADLLAEPGALKVAVNKLLVTPTDVEAPWSIVESYFEGSKTREENATTGDVELIDGEVKGEFDGANKHATLFPPGVSRRAIRSLSDFRHVPTPAADLYTLGSGSGGRVSLRQGLGEWVVDEAAGVVYRYVMRDEAGRVRLETIHDGYITYPGQIVFPSLAVTASYVPPGKLYAISITLIEEAHFNIELPKGTFALAVPAQTHVLDRRQSDRARTFYVREGTDDTVARANAHIELNRPVKPGGVRWWAVGGSVGLLLIFGGWLLRRYLAGRRLA